MIRSCGVDHVRTGPTPPRVGEVDARVAGVVDHVEDAVAVAVVLACTRRAPASSLAVQPASCGAGRTSAPASFHLMPESSTAIRTSGRPVVVCQAVSTVGSGRRRGRRAPRTARAGRRVYGLPGSAVAAYFQSLSSPDEVVRRDARARPCTRGRCRTGSRPRPASPRRRGQARRPAETGTSEQALPAQLHPPRPDASERAFSYPSRVPRKPHPAGAAWIGRGSPGPVRRVGAAHRGAPGPSPRGVFSPALPVRA